METSYKEKYEKALEKIKNLIDKDHNDINVDDILNVFPELAESKDEKVRKEIIDLIMQPIWKTEKEFHRRNELCAWIKKQGQVKESTISQHENRTCEENGNSLTSEDERIRKEIINYFRCQSEEEPTRKEIHDKWIAWLENIPYTIDHEKREGFHLGYRACLEKQEMSYTKKDVDDAFVEGMALAKDELEKQGDSFIKWNKNTKDNKPEKHHSVLMKTTYGIAEGEWQGEKWFQYRWSGRLKDGDVLSWVEFHDLEKQSEQKLEMKTAEESLGIDSDTYNKIVDECIFDEQKPADKVEPKFKVGEKELTEEELREGLIRGMINEHNRVVKEVLRTEYEKGRADAIAEMQKEWSDIDKDILFRIIDDLKFLRDTISIDPKYAVNIIDMEREITWLKSLRPQNQWKPSDEQIGLLQAIINEPNNASSESCQIVLKNILEQLKKLKEGKV